MCFSASVSFGAGIVLSTVGVISIKKVTSASHFFFASIPFIFAIQQISEGFLWLALTNPSFSFLNALTTYSFLFFAQIVWPFWVPFSILKLAQNGKRKNALKILTGIGALVSIYLTYCLSFFHVHAEINERHIAYVQHYPLLLGPYSGVLYVIATTVPAFCTEIKRMWLLAFAILISYIISEIFYEDYLVSVWCFFASIISTIIAAVMDKTKNQTTFILVK